MYGSTIDPTSSNSGSYNNNSSNKSNYNSMSSANQGIGGSSRSPFDHKIVIQDCLRLKGLLQTVSDSYRGPIERSDLTTTALPFVLVLGNHSSGKSSFINFLCGQTVQNTGIAPTDDHFTLIGAGDKDYDRSGQALMEDDKFGFQGLAQFGQGLVQKTKLKIRSKVNFKDFMIVDSPGMIDSPTVAVKSGSPSESQSSPLAGATGDWGESNSIVSQLSSSSASSLSSPADKRKVVMERGYDFEGVCSWLAERADVILLFFDPDKPGTTGETLSVLTNSLAGYDNKIHIILNKADKFSKIHDFARAYGSLCWNLSKVIHRKDLPQIHTLSLFSTKFLINNSSSNSNSVALSSKSSSNSSAGDLIDGNNGISSGDLNSAIRDSILDLEESRNDIIREVFNAPYRRIDNEISRVSSACKALHFHVAVLNGIIDRYLAERWSVYRGLLLSAAMYATASFVITSTAQQIFGLITSLSDLQPTPSTPSSSTPASATAPSPSYTTAIASNEAMSTAVTAAWPRLPLSYLSSVSAATATASSTILQSLRNVITSGATIIGRGITSVASLLVKSPHCKTIVGLTISIISSVSFYFTVRRSQQGLDLFARRLTDPSMAEQRAVFEQLYALDCKKGFAKTSQVESLWLAESEHLRSRFSYQSFMDYVASNNNNIFRTSRRGMGDDLVLLNRMQTEDIPALRQRASPDYQSLKAPQHREINNVRGAGSGSTRNSINVSNPNGNSISINKTVKNSSNDSSSNIGGETVTSPDQLKQLIIDSCDRKGLAFRSALAAGLDTKNFIERFFSDALFHLPSNSTSAVAASTEGVSDGRSDLYPTDSMDSQLQSLSRILASIESYPNNE